MRQNRKMSQRMSVVTVHFMHMGAVVMMLFAMVILNLLAMSRCSHLENSIGVKNKELEKLEAQFISEESNWQALQTPENLEHALRRHGLSMHIPNPSQVVRMRSDGRPVEGQLSLAKAEVRARAASGAVASSSVTVNRRRSSARRR